MLLRPDPDPAVASAVATVLDACTDVVTAALRQVAATQPVVAACLWHSDIEEELAPIMLSVGTVADRERAKRQTRPFMRFHEAWNPMTYEEEPPLEDTRGRPGFVEAEAATFAALRAKRVLDPARWVLDEVARRATLTARPPSATDDFVVFLIDDQFGDDLVASLLHAAPAAVAQRLNAQGLLPRDVGDLLDLDT